MFFVRTAMESDLGQIKELLAQSWHATYDELIGAEKVHEITSSWHSPDRLRAQLTMPHSEFLVADDGKRVGGMAFADCANKRINLRQLHVLPSLQGQKIGFHLLIEIENSFPEANSIDVDVLDGNEGAIRFYKKYGFEVSGKTDECGEQGSGLPAVLMSKNIEYADQ